ncbi:MAG: hypothetical protein HY975_02655 [Candidatus Kerfeldbacteria bacterium]|nr:hypothetical protein [Candidatus Kerfeldbacteria bacterium]
MEFGPGPRLLALLVGLLAFAYAPTVQAQATSTESVSISAVVADTTPAPSNPSVEFHGIAAPGAVVTVLRGGAQVGSITAGGDASFTVALVNQPVGQQSYDIQASDATGHSLAPVTFALNLTAGTNTIISGIFLGPSIGVDKPAVKLGQFLTVSGTTAPSSAVTLTVSSETPTSFTVSSDGLGRWSKLVNSQEIGVGTHTATARALLGGNQVSAQSATVTFAVNPLEQCDGKKTADLNCDAAVNLTDFSILLYFWQQTTPSNGRADINGDGRVDVVDFSIMLYQWTA